MSPSTTTRRPDDEGRGGERRSGSALGFWAGAGTVFQLESRQRMRSRGWYVMLAVWFVVTALVAGLAAWTAGSEEGFGQVMFELVIGFVLFFGLLVAPALSANTITGDRAGGTLAILQNTLLTPGQILCGKWLAAWVSSLAFLLVSVPMIIWAMTYGDVYLPAVPVLVLLTAVEMGIACAIGVGISARSARPLFAIVASYLVVALLGLGTVIIYGLSFQLVKGTAMASEQIWPDDPWDDVQYNDQGEAVDAHGEVIEDQEAYFAEIEEKAVMNYDGQDFTCGKSLSRITVYHTERNTWLLAANPFVVVADAAPVKPRAAADDYYGEGPMEAVSSIVRQSQRGAAAMDPCLDGVKQPVVDETDLAGTAPLWPLGLGVQVVLAAGLLESGRRRLRTPVKKLARGSRLA
ncbi:MAG: ABC transporter permease [Micrococcaceae bacterium]|nr:ABC transporter permease [Micrococcaceae bacterium]